MVLPKIAALLTALAAISALGADVEGVVTFHRSPDSYFFLETVSGEVWRVQRDSNAPRVSIGDVVHVGGHRIKGIVTPRFKADVMRKLGHDKSLLPRPERVSIGELLLDPVADTNIVNRYGRIVISQGVVREKASMASGRCGEYGLGPYSSSCGKGNDTMYNMYNMMQRPAAAQIKHYRRFHGYDYSRGASIFVTFAVKGRLPLFGRVDGDKVILSPAGKAALDAILFENERPGRRVWAASFVIMPDHIHLRLVLMPDSGEEPLRHIGQFVNNVKRWSRKHAADNGIEVAWEENYHDYICVSRFINEKVDAYIGYNPLKWALMHGPDALLKVVEPLISPRVPEYEWWSAAGNVDLLGPERRIAAVSVSRTTRVSDHLAIAERLVKAAKEGWVIASTFISPGEIEIYNALDAEGLPCIKASPDPLKMVYRPHVEDTLAFAEGRLAVVSRECSPDISRYDAWHGMNDAMAKMAAACGGGLGVYIHRKGARSAAAPIWERR